VSSRRVIRTREEKKSVREFDEMFFFDVGAGVPASIISAREPRIGDITRDNPRRMTFVNSTVNALMPPNVCACVATFDEPKRPPARTPDDLTAGRGEVADIRLLLESTARAIRQKQ
jgi:hypothetical protein